VPPCDKDARALGWQRRPPVTAQCCLGCGNGTIDVRRAACRNLGDDATAGRIDGCESPTARCRYLAAADHHQTRQVTAVRLVASFDRMRHHTSTDSSAGAQRRSRVRVRLDVPAAVDHDLMAGELPTLLARQKSTASATSCGSVTRLSAMSSTYSW